MSRSNKVGPCFTKNESKVGLHTSYDIMGMFGTALSHGKRQIENIPPCKGERERK